MGETRFKAYITGYSFFDNTPPGSPEISDPVIHQTAAGTGTYCDPITVAVGHSITNGVDTLDFPKGTTFYVPNLRKYFLVEDTCGDGNTPQNGACHKGFPSNAVAWLDVWIDGRSGTRAATDACMDAITKVSLVIRDPARTYRVVPGPVFNAACAQQFGDTVVNA